jgi:hypothetical protein
VSQVDPRPDLAESLLSSSTLQFVDQAAQTALRLRIQQPFEDSIDTPTLVYVDAGDDSTPAEAPARVLEKVPEATDVAGAAKPAAAAQAVFEVRLDNRLVRLACTEDALMGYTMAAFKVGGFPAVVRARVAIDKAVTALGTAATAAKDTADATHAKLAEEEGLYRSQPTSSRAGIVDSLQSAASESDRSARAASAAAAGARGNAERYRRLFGAAWSRLAAAEEACLREWEVTAAPEFAHILETNMKAAVDQWTRYGCHVKDKPDQAADITQSRGKASELQLSLQKEPPDAKSGSGTTTDTGGKPALPTLRDLWTRANELRGFAERIPSAQHVARSPQVSNDPTASKLQAAHIADEVKAWSTKRDETERTDPVLLQVYPDVTGQTTLDTLERMIIEALLLAYHVSKEISDHAVRLFPAGSKLRIEPKAARGDPLKPWGLSKQELDVVSSADETKALELGLVIPASVVLGVKLGEAKNAEYSVWAHLPVRVAVAATMKKDARLVTFTVAGALQEAAMTHAFEELERVRKRHKERWRSRSMVVLGLGVLLAPFTSGGSLVVAGIIQAGFCAPELYEAWAERSIAGELSQSSLSAVETALWTRPSTVDFVRLVVSETIDFTLGVVPPERVALVVGLALSAVSTGVRPEERGKR